MKKFFSLVAVFWTMMFFSIQANASLLIEPHLGYIVTGGVANYFGDKYDYTGPQYGAKLGVQYWGIMWGVDYTHSTYTLNDTVISSGTKTTAAYKQDEMGVFVGYAAPILLRVWMGYYFSTKVTQTDSGDIVSKGDWQKGKTTEFGVGLTPLPLISVNLMYRMLSLDKASNSGVESTLTTKCEPREVVLGVSLPFHLL